MGIPAEESREYIFRQAEKFQNYLMEDGFSMKQAVDSIRGCIVILGGFIIGIVSSILFLQEREKMQRILKRSGFYQKAESLGKELLAGVKGYLKAQVKITGLICVLCVAGFWILKIPYFLGLGLAVGILDGLPVLGTGDVPYTGWDTAPFPGRDFSGSRGFPFVCGHCRAPADPGTQAGRRSCRNLPSSDPAFYIPGTDDLRRIRVYSGTFNSLTSIWDLSRMGPALDVINYKDFSKTLKKFYKQWEIFWTNKKFRV